MFFLKFSEGYLYSIPVYCDDERDDQQDIKLLAYHYVEDFGEEGHILVERIPKKFIRDRMVVGSSIL